MHTAFEGKVALVPGAPRGIGLATAKAFAMAGASVVVADHNEKLLNEAAEKLRGRSQRSRRNVRRTADSSRSGQSLFQGQPLKEEFYGLEYRRFQLMVVPRCGNRRFGFLRLARWH